MSTKTCACIINPDWNYLLQRRSDNMKDGSSNQLSLFGWWVEDGETTIQWLIRELDEELELDTSLCTITYIDQHASSTGIIFEIYEITMLTDQDLVLHEWSAIEIISPEHLNDGTITSWFGKINILYLNYLSKQ